jgi:hypothetical protein
VTLAYEQTTEAEKLAADWRWMLAYLRAHGGKATNCELQDASLRERGCRFTPHSRAADIREYFRRVGAAEWLYCQPLKGGKRRDYLYWLGSRMEGE